MVLAAIAWQSIAEIVNLILVVVVLYRLLYKPANQFLAGRQEEVQTALREAEKRKQEAEAQLREYQGKLEDAERQAQSILDRARQTGKEASDQILQEAKLEANRILDRAQKDAKAERERALAEIRAQVVDAAVEAAEKAVIENLSDDDQLRIARKFIGKVGEAQ